MNCRIFAALLSLIMISAAHAASFSDPTLNFTLEVPARYQQLPDQPNVVAGFATSDPAKGLPDVTIGISRLGGLIGREHIDPAKVPIPNVTLSSMRWKTFDVDVISGHLTKNGETLAFRGAQIPLKPEAIQLTVVVPLSQEHRADAALQELLASLDGKSNWLTDGDRYQRLGEVSAPIIVGVVVGVYFVVKKLRQKSF